MEELSKRTLQIEESPRFQEREWQATRVTWILLLLVMLATGLGFFGNGPLSAARAGQSDGPLWVEYARFGRYGATVRLTVHARSQADGVVRVTVGRSLLEAFRIEQITPQPGAGRFTEDGVEYRIDAGRQGHTPIIFELQPVRRWLVQGAIQSAGRTVHFTQFIYP